MDFFKAQFSFLPLLYLNLGFLLTVVLNVYYLNILQFHEINSKKYKNPYENSDLPILKMSMKRIRLSKLQYFCQMFVNSKNKSKILGKKFIGSPGFEKSLEHPQVSLLILILCDFHLSGRRCSLDMPLKNSIILKVCFSPLFVRCQAVLRFSLLLRSKEGVQNVNSHPKRFTLLDGSSKNVF